MESASTSGAYLGQSPHHAANVSLILNPATGYISPQFHCTYNNYFETPKLEGRIDVHWKRLAKLQEDEETELYDKEFDMIQGKPLKDYKPPPPLFPLDKDEDSDSYEEGDSVESEGEIDASRTQSGCGYQNDDDDDDDLYIPQPLSKAPPWQRRERHPSKVIDVEEAESIDNGGSQYSISILSTS